MTVQNAATLKSYFENGDIPDENAFSDLIDTIIQGDSTILSSLQSIVQTRVNTHINSSLHSYYNVKTYGALGNGTADDTAAIQLAINACETAGGGTVFFPKGTYIVTTNIQETSCLVVDSPNVTLLGEGVDTIIQGDSETPYLARLITITGDDVEILGITWDNSLVNTGIGILVVDCDRININHCRFTTPAFSIVINGTVLDLIVVNNYGYGSGGSFFLGNDIDGCSQWTISNNIIRYDDTGDWPPVAISINAPEHGFEGGVINSNIIIGMRNVVSVPPWWDGVTLSVAFGIALAHCSHMVVDGNYINDVAGEGIHVEDRSHDVVISNNVIMDCDWAGIGVQPVAAGVSEGIFVENFSITGNIVRGCCKIPGLDRGNGGIDLSYDVFWTKNINISNNVCILNEKPGIYLESIYGLILVGNICNKNKDAGILAIDVPNSIINTNICKNSIDGPGISLEDFQHSIITTNQCYDDQDTEYPESTVKTQTYGLYLSGESLGAKIEGNKFNDNLTGNIYGLLNDLNNVVLRAINPSYPIGPVISHIKNVDEDGIFLGMSPLYDYIYGPELVSNGNFETNDPETNWFAIPEGSNDSTRVADERTGGLGTMSIDAMISDEEDQIRLSSSISLSSGKTYRFSGWAKNIDGSWLSIVIFDVNGDTPVFIDKIINTEWKQFTRDFVLTEDCETVDIMVHGESGQHGRFDDISIKEIITEEVVVEYGSELVSDGHMESSSPGTYWLDGGLTPILTRNEDPRTGSLGVYSLNVEIASAQTSGVIYQNIPVESGKTYRLSGWQKLISGTKVNIYVYNNAWTLIMSSEITSTIWNEFIEEFEADDTLVRIYIGIFGVATDKGRWDDISLKEIIL